MKEFERASGRDSCLGWLDRIRLALEHESMHANQTKIRVNPQSILQSQRGMGLTGVIMATGIGGILALAFASLMTGLFESQNTVKYRSQLDTFTDEVRTLLSSPVACHSTFTGTNLTSATNREVTEIRDASAAPGAVIYAKNGVYGDRSLRLAEMRLMDYRHEVGVVGWATLQMNYIAQQKGTGPENISRTIRLRTERDTSNNLTACTALSKMSDGIWQRVSTSPNDIFFQEIGSGGRVGIGAVEPQSALHITGPAAGASTRRGVHLGMSGDYASIELKGTAAAAGGGFIDFGHPANDYRGRIVYDNASNSMAMHTAGTPRVTVTNTGSVGVGTASPAGLLAVGAANQLLVTPEGDIAVTGGADGRWALFKNGVVGEILAIDPGANVGFNQGTVAFNGGAATFAHNANFNNGATVPNGNLVIQNGNLGLGTTTPEAKLDVRGGVKVGTASACSASTAGTLRYESGSARMEYCNGSDWVQVGGGRGCAAGSQSAWNLDITVDPCDGKNDVTMRTGLVNCPRADHYKVVTCTSGSLSPDPTFLCLDGVWSQVAPGFHKTRPGRCSCFSAATLVTMADGSRLPITDVKVGDMVLGSSGRVNRVVALDRTSLNERAGQFYMRINGENEEWVTNNHPLLTTEGWKALDVRLGELEAYDQLQGRLGRLQVGDHLLLEDGKTVEITSLEIVAKHRSEKLYNLQVDGDHTFVANGVVVHAYVPSSEE